MLGIAIVIVFVFAMSVFAQQPAGRGGAANAEALAWPSVLFHEEWRQPSYTGQLTDEKRRVTQEAVTNPALELKLYGADSKSIEVYNHENRFDLWSGMATSPTAITVRMRDSYMDLTGTARLRTIVRTQALHTLYPVVKLADGAMLASSQGVYTDGAYVQVEAVFGGGVRWFKLDSAKVVTTLEVKNPDLSKVDEIGWVDLAPGGGHGNAGWYNVSTFEVLGKAIPRLAATSN
ncbi:MAG: hypothetical protein ABL986_15025 [Vicinamibacterales bacterium]